MSGSTQLLSFPAVVDGSEMTTGFFNSRFNILQSNILSLNTAILTPAHLSESTWAALNVEISSASSSYIRFRDSSNLRSTYHLGSFNTNTADGLNIWDESGQTMIVSFSKQSVRFFQNIVGPVFDTGGANTDSLNAGTFGTAADSIESRIQATINAASNGGISRVYVPSTMLPYSASSISFIQSVQMTREGGDNVKYDIVAYGAGPGIASKDGPAWRAVLDMAPPGATIVLPSGKSYLMTGRSAITNRDGLTVEGWGAVVYLSGTSAQFLKFSGATNSNIKVLGIRVIGSGNSHDDQGAFGTDVQIAEAAGGRGLQFIGVSAESCARGIYFESGGNDGFGGTAVWRDMLVSGCLISDSVGTVSGRGDAIVLGSVYQPRVIGNAVLRAQRHAIYTSNSTGAIIEGNHIKDHRLGVSVGGQFSALAVARGHDSVVVGNVLENCDDTAISFEANETDVNDHSRGFTCIGNTIIGSPYRDIVVGTDAPQISGEISDVVISGNAIRRTETANIGAESIRVYYGQRVNVSDNAFYFTSAYTLIKAAVVIGLTGSSYTFTNNIRFARNSFRMQTGVGGVVYAFEISPSLSTGTSSVFIQDNLLDFSGSGSSGLILYDATRTSNTIQVMGNTIADTVTIATGPAFHVGQSPLVSMRTLAASSLTVSAGNTNVQANEAVFTVGGASGASFAVHSGGTIYIFNSALSAKAT